MDRVKITCGNCGSETLYDAGALPLRDDAERVVCTVCLEPACPSEIVRIPAEIALDSEARGRLIAQVAREVATLDPEAFDTADDVMPCGCCSGSCYCDDETGLDVSTFDGIDDRDDALDARDCDDEIGWNRIDPSERFPIGANPFAPRPTTADIRASIERGDWRDDA